MGLRKCFQAVDLQKYRGPRGLVGINPTVLYGEKYYNELITSPRYYYEELFCYETSGATPGVIWVERENNPYGDFVIKHFAIVAQVNWPSWATVVWKYDAQYGHLLEIMRYGTAGFEGEGTIVYDFMCYSPDGGLWWFGPHADAYHGGPLAVSTATFAAITENSFQIDEWEAALGRSLVGVSDFNVDRGRDRIWFRWMTNNVGQVSLYKLSTKEHLADLWTPNQTAGIVCCRDGWTYIKDVCDWICIYDYDGTYFSSFRHPRREPYFGAGGGVAWGWDQYYRRLLMCAAVANSTDGACRNRVKGYYPNPEPQFLTDVVPRQAPRAGRKTVIFSHLGGEGLEPIGSRRATFSGPPGAQSTATDNEGDAINTVVPAASGSLHVGLTVDATVPTPDPAEPNETYAGRTLIVRQAAPTFSDADVTHPNRTVHLSLLSVTGDSGGYSVEWIITSVWYDEVHLVGDSVDWTSPLSAYEPAPGPYYGCYAIAIVTDGTGNKGQSDLKVFSL